MLKLIGTDGTRYYSWALEKGKFTLGRLPECDFTINDKTVSRSHAELEFDDDTDTCYINDLGSHNGTMVNGQRITSRVQVKVGDRIMFGFAEFKLASGDDATPTTGETRVPTTQLLVGDGPEKSVFLSIKEALKPLPSKVTDLPEVMSTLFDMAKMLVLPEPQQVMLEKSLALVAKAIPAERLAVMLVREEGGELYTAACHMAEGKDAGTFQLSRTIVGEVLSNNNAVLMGDPESDPRFSSQQSIIMAELKSAMAVPLFVEGKVLGILYADTSNPLHRYSNDYLRLLATYGNLIAFRILNYSLLAERHEKEVMDAELRRATVIQGNLLPSKIPDIDGLQIHAFQEQCRAVGGDLYDLAVLPNGHLMYMVADVSGKGMGAALLMANILASFRILYDDASFDLCRAVKMVSLQLCEHSSIEDFATLFIGRVNPETGEMHFVNAGHNPALHISADGQITLLEASGTMIGAFPFSDWKEDKITLKPGDLLTVYSDGVVEAEKVTDTGEELYSEERFNKLVIKNRELSPDKLIKRVMEDILSFVEDSPRSDDITMLLIKKDS